MWINVKRPSSDNEQEDEDDDDDDERKDENPSGHNSNSNLSNRNNKVVKPTGNSNSNYGWIVIDELRPDNDGQSLSHVRIIFTLTRWFTNVFCKKKNKKSN